MLFKLFLFSIYFQTCCVCIGTLAIVAPNGLCHLDFLYAQNFDCVVYYAVKLDAHPSSAENFDDGTVGFCSE